MKSNKKWENIQCLKKGLGGRMVWIYFGLIIRVCWIFIQKMKCINVTNISFHILSNQILYPHSNCFSITFLNLGQPHPHVLRVQGKVHIFEIWKKAQDPDQSCIDKIPLNNHNILVVIISRRNSLRNQSNQTVDPNYR